MNSLVNCLPSQIHGVLEGQVGHKFWGVYSARAMAVLQAPSDQVYAAFTESADHLKRCQLSKAIQARKRQENPSPRQPRNPLLKRMKPTPHSSQDLALQPPDGTHMGNTALDLAIPDAVPPSSEPQFLSEFLISLVSNGLVRVLDDNATATKIVWNAYDVKGTFAETCKQTNRATFINFIQQYFDQSFRSFCSSTGQVVKSKFVTTTWWKLSSPDFHVSCRGCLAVNADVGRDQMSDCPLCLHSFLFPMVCEALGVRHPNLSTHLQSLKTKSFDLITSKFFSDCGSSDAESVIELSSYGRKKVFLAILKPEDAAQYGLADKSWSVCTVTEHVKRNTFLVSHSLWAHS